MIEENRVSLARREILVTSVLMLMMSVSLVNHVNHAGPVNIVIPARVGRRTWSGAKDIANIQTVEELTTPITRAAQISCPARVLMTRASLTERHKKADLRIPPLIAPLCPRSSQHRPTKSHR